MSVQEFIANARAKNAPELLVEKIPYAKALGIGIHLDGDRLLGQMDFQQRLIGDIGVGALHGGTVGALLESTAIFTLLWEVEETKMPRRST